MLTLLVFIFILSFLVMIHEFGHFIAAKKSGVRVEEFGLGIPPKLFGFKRGETEYTLNLLPFGGFVRLAGEDEDTTKSASPDQRSFAIKKPIVRAIILVAGIFMNFLASFTLYYILLSANSFKSATIPLFFDYSFKFGDVRRINTVITGFEKDSPADKGGFKTGESIVEIEGKPVYSVTEVREVIQSRENLNTNLVLVDVRGSKKETRSVNVTPVKNAEGKVVLGVLLGSAANIYYDQGANRLFAGPMHAYNMTTYTFFMFSKLISASFEAKDLAPVSSGVSGPVGVFNVVGEIVESTGADALFNLLDLTALLSLSLGVMNLLPIPALDGGRLLFVLIEMTTGKKIHPAKEALIHRVGMALLLALMILVTFKDLRNLF